MLPKFLWLTLPLNKKLSGWVVGCSGFFIYLSLRHFKYVSSRPLLSSTLMFLGMPSELNNSMILLPEWAARFRVARSTHASCLCRLSVPLVLMTKLCKTTHSNLAARHSIQVHSSVFFPGPGMQLHTLVGHSQCICLCWSALCYPDVPGAAADTSFAFLALYTQHRHLQLCCPQVLLNGLVLEELDSSAWCCVSVILL